MPNRQDYSKNDVFVPAGAFKAVPDPGQGPKNPVPQNLGPTAENVFEGPVYGGIRDDGGARMMDSEHPRFKAKKLPESDAVKRTHLPENA